MSPEPDKPKKKLPPNAGKGRPPGALNKATKAIKEASEKLLSDKTYQASLKKRLKAGKAPHMELLLHHYAYGKPKDTVRVEEAPARLEVIALRTKGDIQRIKGAFDGEAMIDEPDDDE